MAEGAVMSVGKWTLGQWRTPGEGEEQDELTFWSAEFDGDPAGACYTSMPILAGTTTVALVVWEGWDDEEGEANAALIAAAPDMAEALHNARVLLSAFVGPDDEIGQLVLSEADKTLAKARGQL